MGQKHVQNIKNSLKPFKNLATAMRWELNVP